MGMHILRSKSFEFTREYLSFFQQAEFQNHFFRDLSTTDFQNRKILGRTVVLVLVLFRKKLLACF